MTEGPAILTVETGNGRRQVPLARYLRPADAERAEQDAHDWIKSLRHVPIDGVPLRDRFTFRGDSLWWFAELYLHKRRVVVSFLQALYAIERAIEIERPRAIGLASGDYVVGGAATALADQRAVAWVGPRPPRRPPWRVRMEPVQRGWFYALTALADRLRPGHAVPDLPSSPKVAAFVHTAFWRQATDDESYIGPILREIAQQAGAPDALRLVGLGPRTNFRARSWQQRLSEFRDPRAESLPVVPVEIFASAGALAPSVRVWRDRRSMARAFRHSADLRARAAFHGCDAWPLLAPEFDGIAYLQFPWSARAMDEAGAALDALKPGSVITYAEAGGWGRSLVLEARRRGISIVGIQHGFIYRHWLNYRHEADEMQPSAGNQADRGFPRPDLTLVFDQFAARHLLEAGRFPPESVAVSGNPKLDAFVAGTRDMGPAEREAVKASVGARPDQALVVVATKHSQMAGAFEALVQAAAPMPEVHVVVKCHPAETPAPYLAAAGSAPNVTVAPASADLARLIASAGVLVTVNSTAAIEAMVLDVPALILALPNNLSPFVDAGAMAGVGPGEEIGPVLRAILYDEEFRQRLRTARRTFMQRFQIRADGRAAGRAAETILRLAGAPAGPPRPCGRGHER
jgi:hypothetical protein